MEITTSSDELTKGHLLSDCSSYTTISPTKTVSGPDVSGMLPQNIASWESQCTLFERARAISPNGRVDFVLANAWVQLAEVDFA